MKLTIDSSTLAKTLKQAAKFVSNKPLMQILGNLKLDATDRLNVTGFDLSHGIEIHCNAEIIDSGNVCIPTSSIAIIKAMIGQLIVESDENNLITISSLSGKAEIQGLPVDEYPELIEEESEVKNTYKISSKFFTEAIKYCTQSASTDPTKAILTGVNIMAIGGVLRAIATDGHRLTVYNMPVGESVNIPSITIPAKSLAMVQVGTADEIELTIDTRQLAIRSGKFGSNRSIMRVLDGKYPDVMLLIPKSFSRAMEIDRKALIDALNLMSAIGSENSLVKFSIEDCRVKISSTSEGKSGNVDIDIKYQGEAIDIAFNLKYLLDGLKMFDSKQIKISINEPIQPVIVTTVDSELDLIYLAMPVQIRS